MQISRQLRTHTQYNSMQQYKTSSKHQESEIESTFSGGVLAWVCVMQVLIVNTYLPLLCVMYDKVIQLFDSCPWLIKFSNSASYLTQLLPDLIVYCIFTSEKPLTAKTEKWQATCNGVNLKDKKSWMLTKEGKITKAQTRAFNQSFFHIHKVQSVLPRTIEV